MCINRDKKQKKALEVKPITKSPERPKTSSEKSITKSFTKELDTGPENHSPDNSRFTEEQNEMRKRKYGFLERAYWKQPQGLRAEFQKMKRSNDFEKMKAFSAAQEHGKNRYKDVGCLDDSRVKLAAPWPHEYIHANYVSTCDDPKRFICTQGPLEKTCADFWFMCLQERVEVIVMLCNFVEKGAKKCFEYFPTKDKPKNLIFEEEGQEITVKFLSSQPVEFKEETNAKVFETMLQVNGPNDMTMNITHYHWTDWPDRGVPPADMAIIELLEKAKNSKGPIVVHCSAGIGRSGCFVMIEYILEKLQRGQKIEDTDKILQKIREQRNNSLQTDCQYLFVHQVLLQYFLHKRWIDEKVICDFTANYLKLTKG